LSLVWTTEEVLVLRFALVEFADVFLFERGL